MLIVYDIDHPFEVVVRGVDSWDKVYEIALKVKEVLGRETDKWLFRFRWLCEPASRLVFLTSPYFEWRGECLLSPSVLKVLSLEKLPRFVKLSLEEIEDRRWVCVEDDEDVMHVGDDEWFLPWFLKIFRDDKVWRRVEQLIVSKHFNDNPVTWMTYTSFEEEPRLYFGTYLKPVKDKLIEALEGVEWERYVEEGEDYFFVG